MLESIPEVEEPLPEVSGEVLDLEKKLVLDSYFDEEPATEPFDEEPATEPAPKSSPKTSTEPAPQPRVSLFDEIMPSSSTADEIMPSSSTAKTYEDLHEAILLDDDEMFPDIQEPMFSDFPMDSAGFDDYLGLPPLDDFENPNLHYVDEEPLLNDFEEPLLNDFDEPLLNDFEEPLLNEFEEPLLNDFEDPTILKDYNTQLLDELVKVNSVKAAQEPIAPSNSVAYIPEPVPSMIQEPITPSNTVAAIPKPVSSMIINNVEAPILASEAPKPSVKIDMPKDGKFDCYELDNGNHVCSTDTSTLEDGYMIFSKYEHDAVATAKEMVDKALEDPVEEIKEMVVEAPEVPVAEMMLEPSQTLPVGPAAEMTIHTSQ